MVADGRALAMALAAIALWSTNAVVARHALAGMPVALVQLLQFGGAAGVFLAIRLARRETARLPAPPPAAIAIGIVGFTGTMMFQYLAFASMAIAPANLIAYGWPLIAAAGLIAGGKAARPRLLAVTSAAGFVGAGMIILDAHGGPPGAASPIGVLAAFASAGCMAFYTLAIGPHAHWADRLLMPAALAGMALACLWWGAGGEAGTTGGLDIAAGLYLGAGPMGLGYILWSRALGRDGTGRLPVLAYLTPVFSTALLSAAGEKLGAAALAGAALVVATSLVAGIDRLEAAGGE